MRGLGSESGQGARSTKFQNLISGVALCRTNDSVSFVRGLGSGSGQGARSTKFQNLISGCSAAW